MTTEIVSYSATEAAIAGLTARYKNVVFDVTTAQGMTDAKSSYKEINTHSITLEAARVKEKAESLIYGRKVDSEAKRIADQLDALRLPIKAMIETETKREEREREAKVQAEIARLAAEEKARKEAEEKRMAAEHAEIARRQEELAKVEREAREKIEAAQRESRRKIEEDQRAARAAQDEADRIARQAREADEQRFRAERERIEAERRAAEEVKRKEQAEAEVKAKRIRDAAEAQERETQRQRQELMDGNALLKQFVARFGKRAEFAKITSVIEKFLERK